MGVSEEGEGTLRKNNDANMILVFKEASEFFTTPSIFQFHKGPAS